MVKPAVQKSDPSTPDTVVSSLMPWVLGEPREDRRLFTLDFGYATAPTVHFFSQFTCTLSFVALIVPEIKRFNSNQLTHEDRVEQFQQALNLPMETQIDIILFWDLLCYLDKHAIRALLEALQPHIHSGSRGHSIGLLNNRYQLPCYEYGILDRNSLIQQPIENFKAATYSHSRQQFNDSLGYLTVDKSCLLADGRVENVLLVQP